MMSSIHQPFLGDWLSKHNHEANRDEKILGIYISINAIQSDMDILDSMPAKGIVLAT